MTGKSNMRVLEEAIEAAGGEETVFDRIASGEMLINLADDFGVSRGLLYKWIGQTEKRRERLREARQMSASVLADEARDILETSTKSTIPVDRERARLRTWLAERFDRKTFGEKKDDVNVEVNIGLMHIQAMKRFRILEEQRIDEGNAEVLPHPDSRRLPPQGKPATTDEDNNDEE